MGFTYHHLDDSDVRAAMVDCWRAENDDLVASGLRSGCYGKDLVEAGWREWETAMPEAFANRDGDWLVEQKLDPSFGEATAREN